MDAVITRSVTGQYMAVRLLSPVHLQIYLLFYSLCYKGNRIKSMRQISYAYIASELKKRYNVELTKRQIKYAADKLVSVGLLDRVTASYRRQIGDKLLPDKASYYRLTN